MWIDIYIEREILVYSLLLQGKIYYKKLAHTIMEAETQES